MPAMGPGKENAEDVQKAYDYIMEYLKENYQIQAHPTLGFVSHLRPERNEAFKEALRQLFELEVWESF